MEYRQGLKLDEEVERRGTEAANKLYKYTSQSFCVMKSAGGVSRDF